MRRARQVVVVAGLAALVLACGGRLDGSSDSSATTSSASDCEAITGAAEAGACSFAQQYCDVLGPCCSTRGRTPAAKRCQLLFVAGLGTSHYDAAKGAQCLDAIRRVQSSMPDFCTSDILAGTDPPECSGVFGPIAKYGTAQPGEACDADNLCAPQGDDTVTCASYYVKNGVLMTLCQDRVAGHEGDTPCVATIEDGVGGLSMDVTGQPPPPARAFVCDVAHGLYCNAATLACTKIGDVGSACDGSAESCVKGTYCDLVKKSCARRLDIGAACSQEVYNCVDGAYCDPGTNTCTPTRAPGAPCTDQIQCPQAQCVNGKCAGSGTGGILDTFCE
jgi:hypothetical protein